MDPTDFLFSSPNNPPLQLNDEEDEPSAPSSTALWPAQSSALLTPWSFYSFSGPGPGSGSGSGPGLGPGSGLASGPGPGSGLGSGPIYTQYSQQANASYSPSYMLPPNANFAMSSGAPGNSVPPSRPPFLAGQVSTQIPGQISSQIRGQVSSQAPGQISSQIPGQVSSRMLGPVPGQVSSQIPGQVSSQIPGQVSSRMLGPVPGQGFLPMPTTMPSLSFAVASSLSFMNQFNLDDVTLPPASSIATASNQVNNSLQQPVQQYASARANGPVGVQLPLPSVHQTAATTNTLPPSRGPPPQPDHFTSSLHRHPPPAPQPLSSSFSQASASLRPPPTRTQPNTQPNNQSRPDQQHARHNQQARAQLNQSMQNSSSSSSSNTRISPEAAGHPSLSERRLQQFREAEASFAALYRPNTSSRHSGPIANSTSLGTSQSRQALLDEAIIREVEEASRAQHFHNSPHRRMVASKASLRSLQKVEITDLPESERVCVICYNEYKVTSPEGVCEDPVRLPKCKHVFGNSCIRKWFQDSHSCPYCRDKLHSEPMRNGSSTRTFLDMMRMRPYRGADNSEEMYSRIQQGGDVESITSASDVDAMATRRRLQDDDGQEGASRRIRQRRSSSSSIEQDNAAAPPLAFRLGRRRAAPRQQMTPNSSGQTSPTTRFSPFRMPVNSTALVSSVPSGQGSGAGATTAQAAATSIYQSPAHGRSGTAVDRWAVVPSTRAHFRLAARERAVNERAQTTNEAGSSSTAIANPLRAPSRPGQEDWSSQGDAPAS